jgi:hypothetical protein
MLKRAERSTQMKMPLSSRLIFALLAILLPLGSHLADFNRTHIFNPNWPPHAKFHGGQTLMFSWLLGICSAFFAWRKSKDRLTSVLAASLFAAVYWIAQIGAIFYPGTAVFDPDTMTPASMLMGIPGQIYAEVFFLLLTGLATWLALKSNAKWTD